MTTIFKGGTNGGANRFFFDKDGDILVSGQGVGGRPEVSGNLGLLAEVWGGTVKSTGTFGGDGTGSAANIVTAQDNGIAKIGGKEVGGQYRFQFDSRDEAQSFIDFVKVVQDQGNLGILFEGKATEFRFGARTGDEPGPGDDRVAISFDDGAEDGVANFRSVEFQDGQRVSVDRFESLDDFIIHLAEEVFDGQAVRTGLFADDFGQRAADGAGPNVSRTDDDVSIGGRGVGGKFQWDFESRLEAARFERAVDRLLENVDMTDAVAAQDDFIL